MKEIYIVNEMSNAAMYGIGSFIKAYIKGLRSMGMKVNLIELNNRCKEFTLTSEDDVTKYTFPSIDLSQKKKYYRSVFRVLRMYLQNRQGMIFHLHYQMPDYFIDYIREHFPAAKVIFTIHYQNWVWQLLGNTYRFRQIAGLEKTKGMENEGVLEDYKLNKSIYEKANAVTCLSQDSYNLLTDTYLINKEKIHLIPNGIENNKLERLSANKKAALKKELFIHTDEKIILYVGRLDKLKGLFSFLAVFGEILEEYPACRLIVVGAAGQMEEALEAYSHIWTKVTFTGRLPREDVDKWYRAADMGIILSYSEECSYVGMEMMSVGLPVVASDGRGVSCMFRHGDNALVAAIGDRAKEEQFRQNIKEQVLSMLASAELRKSLGDRAIQMCESTYSLGNMMAGYTKLIESL